MSSFKLSVPFIYFPYFYVYPDVSWRLLIWGDNCFTYYIYQFVFHSLCSICPEGKKCDSWSNDRRTNEVSESFLCFPNKGQVSFWSKFLFLHS